MKTLIKFELRKIFSRRLTILALAVVIGFSALVTVTTLRGMHSFDGVSQEGSGRKAVAIDRAVAEQYAGPLSDEKVRQILQKFHPQYDLHGMNAKYLQINATQSAVFARFADQDGNWNGLSVSDVFGQEEIQVGYVEGWLCTSRNLAQVLFLLALAVILMTAPVFSGEYAGVDNLILTSRFGRTRGAAAKLAASFLAAGTVTGLCCLLVLLPALLFYGKEGLSCSILFAPAIYLEAWIPFNLSCGTVLGYQGFYHHVQRDRSDPPALFPLQESNGSSSRRGGPVLPADAAARTGNQSPVPSACPAACLSCAVHLPAVSGTAGAGGPLRPVGGTRGGSAGNRRRGAFQTVLFPASGPLILSLP